MSRKTHDLLERPLSRETTGGIARLRRAGRALLSRVGLDRNDAYSPSPIAADMEQRGFAKEAPSLLAQLGEKEMRRTIIESTSRNRVSTEPEALTEGEGIASLTEFLGVASENETFSQEDRDITADMLDNLAFIGDKELKEATEGIAIYWKQQLAQNPNLQLLIQVIESQQGAAADGRSAKSAGFILQNVLDHFSEEEIDMYRDRIIFNPHDSNSEYETKAVLLDDWSISGTQMRQLHYNLEDYSEAIAATEICLVAAPQQLCDEGMSMYDGVRIPVKAYYKIPTPSREAAMAEEVVRSDIYPGYVTGAHSSVDFNFDHYIARLVEDAERQANEGHDVPVVLRTMPALTRIVRPYSKAEWRATRHPRIEQINKNNGHSYTDATGQFIFVRQRPKV